MMIGGNTTAHVIQYDDTLRNKIGEIKGIWEPTHLKLTGWLDLMSADTDHGLMKTVIQESTHVFVMDYLPGVVLKSKNNRLVINDCTYEVIYQDDPMELHEQIEIYLKYIGEEYAGQIY